MKCLISSVCWYEDLLKHYPCLANFGYVPFDKDDSRGFIELSSMNDLKTLMEQIAELPHGSMSRGELILEHGLDWLTLDAEPLRIKIYDGYVE